MSRVDITEELMPTNFLVIDGPSSKIVVALKLYCLSEEKKFFLNIIKIAY
jgi:hypothetical protein